MLYVFFGKDSFSLRERLEALRASLDADGMLSSNTTVLDGRRTTLAEVTAACDTVPFLGSCRLVIVEGLLGRLGGAGSGRRGGQPTGEAAAWAGLPEYVDRMPPSAHLVLSDAGYEGGGAFLDALRGKGEFREFRPPSQRALPDWIRRRAASMRLELAPGAVALLADFIGGDLWTLAGELEKLSVYSGGRRVSEEDVRALVPAVRETTVFPLVDAIVEGRPAAAVRLLRQMFRQESGPPYILSMIQRQLRHVAVAREMLDAGEGGTSVGRRLRLPDFALDRLLDQADRYSSQRVREAFQRLLEADLQIKRGVYEGELALELLVQDLAEPRRASAA